MAVAYRLMRTEEKLAVLSLWSAVYGYTYQDQAARFASDPAALDQLFGPTLQAGQDQGHLMARPIAAGFTDQHLDAIFTAPDAHFSAIDLF
jgi:hypothetical protein